MVAVDTDVLAAAVIIGGIILFSVANRKQVPIPIDPNRYGEVPMETDEWVQEEVDSDKVKKAVFQGGDGDLPGRVQAIVRYMLEEAGKMIQLQKYFDDNFRQAGNKNIAWLKEAYPKEYQNLLVTRAYCANREVEFKQLWFELNQNGEHNWLAANAWVEPFGLVLQN